MAHWSGIRSSRGVALAIAFMVVGTLVTLSAGFIQSTVTELRAAQHYRNSTRAFWLASSGIAEFLHNTAYLDGGPQTIYFGSDYVQVTKDDSDPSERVVRAVGNVGSSRRTIEISFPGSPPDLFSNTMTNGDTFTLSGALARLDVYGKTRIGGNYIKSGFFARGDFEDKQANLGPSGTTLTYPDADGNGTPNEFADFVQFYHNEMNNYSPDEVVWVQTDASVLVFPNHYLRGKKLIFVESTFPGGGDVDILFDATWRNEENLTIVSTGDITYIQPLQIEADSRLNLISWEDYNEASILYSAHNGVTYAHDDANFFSVLNYSETDGNVIANDDINAMEFLTWKVFRYADPLDEGGAVPPGFRGLIAPSAGGYASTPGSWKEI